MFSHPLHWLSYNPLLTAAEHSLSPCTQGIQTLAFNSVLECRLLSSPALFRVASTAEFLMYLFLYDFWPGCLFAVVMWWFLWQVWIRDECTWRHKTFLVQLYCHLAIQLFCFVSCVLLFTKKIVKVIRNEVRKQKCKRQTSWQQPKQTKVIFWPTPRLKQNIADLLHA